MSEQTFKVEVLEGVEPIDSWSSLCKTPQILLTEIAKRLVAVGSFIDANVIASDKVPVASDRRKIWIKTSWPYGIGVVIGGSYQMDYGMTGMVPFTPFLHAEFDPTPGNVRMLSDTEINNFGITNTSSDAPNRMRWYIFEPVQIKF